MEDEGKSFQSYYLIHRDLGTLVSVSVSGIIPLSSSVISGIQAQDLCNISVLNY